MHVLCGMMTVVKIYSEIRLGEARLPNLTKIVIAPTQYCVQVACWLMSVRRLLIFMDACYAHNDEDYRNS